MSNYDKFVNRLKQSTQAVFFVANWLHNKGCNVFIPALKIVGQNQENKNFRDDGDLFIILKRQKIRVEVKKLSVDFTQSYCQYNNLIICAKHSFDNAIQKPYVYFLINKNYTYAAIVKPKITKHLWQVRKVKDSLYNTTQDCYQINFKNINIIKL